MPGVSKAKPAQLENRRPPGQGLGRAQLHLGHRGVQRLGIGLLRRLKDRLSVSLLDDLALTHDHDPVGRLPRHREVMGDEQDRQARRLLHPREQLQNLGQHCHIERGGRLIGQDDLGRTGHRGRSSRAATCRRIIRTGIA